MAVGDPEQGTVDSAPRVSYPAGRGSRASSMMWLKLAAVFVAGGLVGALSIVQVIPQSGLGPGGTSPTGPTEEEDRPLGSETESPTEGETLGPGRESSSTVTGPGKKTGPKGVINPAGLECRADKNGGKTDTGITSNRIKLATTVVRSGFASQFLGEVEWGMRAVVNTVNDKGGVCGRLLQVEYKDDKWDPAEGQRYLTNYMQGDYFAIPVGPSSEGLNKVIRDPDGLSKYKVPVVGADGMVVSQYTHPWVWPVAVSTASSARIMAIDAFNNRGVTSADNFSIVFDRNYKFGQEAAEAFNDEVKARTGQNVRGYPTDGNYSCNKIGETQKTHFCGIDANQSEYGSSVAAFEVTPNGMVAYFMEPATALAWVYSQGYAISGNKVYGAQPLFTRDFGNQCKKACDGMMVWTGFRPYVESYRGEKAMQEYAGDLERAHPGADPTNQFTQGGYVGMKLLAAALEKVGPYLTRANLGAALDEMSMSSGHSLDSVLSWTAANHFSARTMRGFIMKYSTTFSCCEAGPIVADPDPQETERRLPGRVKH